MELLGTEVVNTEKPAGKSNSEKEPTANQMECGQKKQYQETPEVDIRRVQDKKIPPGMMKEILVQANIGQKEDKERKQEAKTGKMEKEKPPTSWERKETSEERRKRELSN